MPMDAYLDIEATGLSWDDAGIDVGLWRRYREQADGNALQTLLEYNQEDIPNLIALRGKVCHCFDVRRPLQTRARPQDVAAIAQRTMNRRNSTEASQRHAR